MSKAFKVGTPQTDVMTTVSPLICTFESRRSDEMRSLMERFGARTFVAPSLKEVPVEENSVALAAIQRMLAGEVRHLILLTGVGTEEMLRLAETQHLLQPLLNLLQRLPLYVRGPQPAAVLHRLGLKYTVKAPEPNTWHDLVQALDDANIALRGTTIAVQEYGVASHELYSALKDRGADVLPIPVYRWALPDDVEPLREAIRLTLSGQFQALLFTSAQQVRHVLMIADQMQQRSEWLNATHLLCVASIGPTCTEALKEEGLPVHFEASPPKMGPLVRGAVDWLISNKGLS